MINDALEGLPPELEAEVCIAGSGPAGIVLALELARRNHHVVLIEGGGLDAPGDGQSIYQGTVTGRPYPLAGSRLRWFGGTSNHWGGWVKPLDEIDFEEKPHFPLPGWPINDAELAPWYDKAAEWCELDQAGFAPASLGRTAQEKLLPLGRDRGFVHRVFRFSPPTRFGKRYRQALSTEERVDCRVHLNAVALEQGDGHIRSLLARTLDGDECRVLASHFVLAMGGIENARFLLNQDDVPGNQADLVGRCFMDHFGFTPGALLADANLAYERGALVDQDVMVVVTPDPSLVQGEGLRNCCLMLRADAPDELIGPEYWRAAPLGDAPGAMQRIGMINEPLPHPESRISLSDERDAIGLRRASLHWHLPPEEFDPVIQLYQRWVKSVSSAGLGRVRTLRREAPEVGAHVGIGYHHMGTTRMSADPEFGVTDSNARCWDRENLFISGSSLFPHVGYSNPTLTIIALAARLADRLAGLLEGRA